MVDKTKAGLLGLITILAVFGGTQYLEPSQLDKTYVCELTEQIGIFDRLSGTSKTGYYFEDGEEKRLACRIGRTYGKWILIKEYCKDRGINVNDLLNKKIEFNYRPGVKYKCSPNGCERMN